jgi:type IV pilus assembly protein PilX
VRAARGQSGAALVIGLILLLVVTILAVSGVVTATLELRMVSNYGAQETAFQTAEAGIEQGLANMPVSTSTVITRTFDNPSTGGTAAVEMSYEGESSSPVTIEGYSLGAGIQAYHFEVRSTANEAGDAVSEHTQGFFIVGPGGR